MLEAEKALREILIAHYQRYPKMTIDDCLKLIYQQTFGPGHFSNNPTLNQIKTYITEELKEASFFDETSCIEDIGNDYHRLSLQIINKHNVSVETLAAMFLASMTDSPKVSDDLKMIFVTKIEYLIKLIDEKILNYHHDEAIKTINEYIRNGNYLMHHSEVYRNSYHPHYRLVHKNHMMSNLMRQLK